MISFIFYRRPPSLKSVTMATRNALFPISKFQKFTNTYLGEVTKFQFNCFGHLGAAFKKPEGGGIRPPVRLGLTSIHKVNRPLEFIEAPYFDFGGGERGDSYLKSDFLEGRVTKILNFALKIKGGGREGGTCEVLRPCHPPPKFGTCTWLGMTGYVKYY